MNRQPQKLLDTLSLTHCTGPLRAVLDLPLCSQPWRIGGRRPARRRWRCERQAHRTGCRRKAAPPGAEARTEAEPATSRRPTVLSSCCSSLGLAQRLLRRGAPIDDRLDCASVYIGSHELEQRGGEQHRVFHRLAGDGGHVACAPPPPPARKANRSTCPLYSGRLQPAHFH